MEGAVANQLEFEVGQAERHQVVFSFDRFSGSTKIRVDGALVDTDRAIFSVKLVKRYEFGVGQAEKHAVAIEKTRKLLFAGFRPSTYNVFVDGKLVLTREL
jgi:hypothetical protein